ncbi:MAG: pantothenate kinase, partial [Streblomastix strix]
ENSKLSEKEEIGFVLNGDLTAGAFAKMVMIREKEEDYEYEQNKMKKSQLKLKEKEKELKNISEKEKRAQNEKKHDWFEKDKKIGKETERESLTDNGKEKGAEQYGISQADLVRTVQDLVLTQISQLVFFMCTTHNVRAVYFGGDVEISSYINNNDDVMNSITNMVKFFSFGQIKTCYMRHEGFVGVIGAMLESLGYSYSSNSHTRNNQMRIMSASPVIIQSPQNVNSQSLLNQNENYNIKYQQLQNISHHNQSNTKESIKEKQYFNNNEMKLNNNINVNEISKGKLLNKSSQSNKSPIFHYFQPTSPLTNRITASPSSNSKIFQSSTNSIEPQTDNLNQNNLISNKHDQNIILKTDINNNNSLLKQNQSSPLQKDFVPPAIITQDIPNSSPQDQVVFIQAENGIKFDQIEYENEEFSKEKQNDGSKLNENQNNKEKQQQNQLKEKTPKKKSKHTKKSQLIKDFNDSNEINVHNSNSQKQGISTFSQLPQGSTPQIRSNLSILPNQQAQQFSAQQQLQL